MCATKEQGEIKRDRNKEEKEGMRRGQIFPAEEGGLDHTDKPVSPPSANNTEGFVGRGEASN